MKGGEGGYRGNFKNKIKENPKTVWVRLPDNNVVKKHKKDIQEQPPPNRREGERRWKRKL